jgi:hypothetical protein
MHIRGPTTKDDSGRVKVQPLTGFHSYSSDEICRIVDAALVSRTVGSSSLHDQSSRSHAIIEYEIVTEDLIAARQQLYQCEADLVPIGKIRDGLAIREAMLMYEKDETTQQWKLKSGYNPAINAAEISETALKFQASEQRLIQAREQITYLKSISPKCVGGTLVFIDLAGMLLNYIFLLFY